MIAGMRISGKHGDYMDNPMQVQGGPRRRKVRIRLYGYVLSSCGENKYLIRFDNKLEKECASNTLKIEEDSVVFPISETNTSSTAATASTADSASITVEDIIEEHEEYDGMSSGEEEDPVEDIVDELRIENIGNISESADPNDDEEDLNDNLEDA